MNLLSEDTLNLFRLFQKHNVKFILVGGLAVNFHGYARATGDIDVWIKEDTENKKALVNALSEYGIQNADALIDIPLLAGYSEIMLNQGIYLDMMGALVQFDKMQFDTAYERAVKFKVDESLIIPILELQMLLEEKRKSGREKDKLDADELDYIID